jgi:hypothetical protein
MAFGGDVLGDTADGISLRRICNPWNPWNQFEVRRFAKRSIEN